MKTLGWPIIVILTIIPVILWMLIMPLTFRFASVAGTSTSIGQLLGIIGMVLFSIAMILSTRLKIFDTLFGGLNRAYIVHHQIGGIAFILLMIHPLSLAVAYLFTSVKSAALFLLPGQDWINNFGIAGLLSLMGLLILTYYVDLPYELWRFSHKFLGIAFLFGAIHVLFVPSDVTMQPVLKIYMFALIACGLLAFTYRSILGRWLVPRLPYTVFDIKLRGDGVYEIILTPQTDKVLTFSPGQFMFIQFSLPGISQETHPFSMSSAPTSKGFSITAKALGDFSSKISTIPLGTTAKIEGPFGRFSPFYVPAQSYVWIAGGIGITPFMSMARALQNITPIDLYYIVKTEPEAVFLQELHSIATRLPGLRVIPWYTKQYGHLTGELIKKYTPDITQREIFLCGPPAMMKGTKTELRKVGISGSRIHSEEFAML